MGECELVTWGLRTYRGALQDQLVLVRLRRRGLIGDTLVSVEHPPTITLGRNASPGDVLATRDELQDRGIEVFRSDRGGGVTFHGPGQAVVYPVVAIEELGLGVRNWVGVLENATIEVLADYDVSARQEPGAPGVWVDDAKIASLGLRIKDGVSYHGVALNVSLAVSGFDCIVPCGDTGARVTELFAVSEKRPSTEEVSARLSAAIASKVSERQLDHG